MKNYKERTSKKLTNSRKRIISSIFGLGMVASMLCYSTASAHETTTILAKKLASNIQYTTSGRDLLSDYKKDSALCQKLAQEYAEHRTSLSEETEKKLNEMGVFDDEINDLSQEQLKSIDGAYNCSVKINYYEEDAKGKYKKMNLTEIDNAVEEKYGEEIEKNKENSGIKSILNKTIFGAVTAGAKTTATTTTSKSGAMKQVLWCVQNYKGGNVRISYLCTWLKRPKYKGVDVIGIYIDDAKVVPKSSSIKHICEYTPHGADYETKSYTDNTPAQTTSNGVAFTFKVFSNEAANIKDERILLQMSCEPKSKKIYAWGTYIHAKKNTTIAPGVSISTGGISVSVSASQSDVYEQITNNPYIAFSTK